MRNGRASLPARREHGVGGLTTSALIAQTDEVIEGSGMSAHDRNGHPILNDL